MKHSMVGCAAGLALLVGCGGSHTTPDGGDEDTGGGGGSCEPLVELGCFEYFGDCCVPAEGPSCVGGRWVCPGDSVLSDPFCVSTECGMEDAGVDAPDAVTDAGAPPLAEPEPACGYLCDAVTGSLPRRMLIPVTVRSSASYNIHISPGVRTRLGTMFSISAVDCCSGSEGDQTTAVLHVDESGDARAEVIFGFEPVTELGRARNSPIFHVGDRPAILRSNEDLSEVAILDEESLSVLRMIDVSGLALGAAPRITPAFATREGGLTVLYGEDTSLRLLDEDLEAAGDPTALGVASEVAALVRMCGGDLMALVYGAGVLYRMRLSADGSPIDSTPVLVRSGLVPLGASKLHAIWDGQSVVVAVAGTVIELGVDGEVVSETPTPVSVLGAVGTSEGVITLEQDGTSGVPELYLRERVTGAELRSLGTIDPSWYASEGALGVDDGRVDVVATSFSIRDNVAVASLSCGG